MSNHNTSPAYTFREGMRLQRVNFSTQEQDDWSLLPPQLFDPAPIDMADHAFTTMHHIGAVPGYVRSQSIGGRSGGKVALHLLPWAGSIDNDVTRHEAVRIYEALPDHRHVFISAPGHGLPEQTHSKHWPLGVRASFLKSGSFLAAGSYIGSHLRGSRILKDVRSVDIFGHSTGGRAAVSLAGQLGHHVENVVLFDPPGAQRLGYSGLLRSFLKHEGTHGRKYTEASPDQQHVAVMQQAKSRKDLGALKAFAKQDFWGAVDTYGSELRALGKGTLEHDLRTASLSYVGRLAIISPVHSELNDSQAMADVLEATQTLHPSVVVEQFVTPGTHTVTRYASTVLASLYQAAYNANRPTGPVGVVD
jgi:pimeloyl-ACP methyl ester carboxylesterase